MGTTRNILRTPPRHPNRGRFARAALTGGVAAVVTATGIRAVSEGSWIEPMTLVIVASCTVMLLVATFGWQGCVLAMRTSVTGTMHFQACGPGEFYRTAAWFALLSGLIGTAMGGVVILLTQATLLHIGAEFAIFSAVYGILFSLLLTAGAAIQFTSTPPRQSAAKRHVLTTVEAAAPRHAA
jgi:hypothetical protein